MRTRESRLGTWLAMFTVSLVTTGFHVPAAKAVTGFSTRRIMIGKPASSPGDPEPCLLTYAGVISSADRYFVLTSPRSFRN
jgi:hypothetical protein